MPELEENSLKGKYTFIGVDIDTTGRRLLDEIVHLAAWSPKHEYEQYILPVMNLNPAARQRHQIRIITVGFFRMLKCVMTNKVVRSKTEISALKSFLVWLEECKANDAGSNGVILIYHEPIKFIPFMLLEAFKRYDLLERFSNVVVALVDGYSLAAQKCANTIKGHTLRQLGKVFFNYDENDGEKNFEGNAMVRARLAYQILAHLAKGEKQDLSSEPEITADLIKDFAHSITADISELGIQNKCIDLQHTFRPIFLHYFKTNLYHRYKAVTFRRVLAEKGYDLKSLEAVWQEKKKEGLEEIISQLDELKEEYRKELVDILDSYCDPDKELIQPVVKRPNRVRRRSRTSRSGGRSKSQQRDAESANERQASTPDSTATPRRNRRTRRRFNSRRRASQDKTEKTKDLTQTQPKPEVSVGGN